MVAHEHRREDRQLEEAGPQPVDALQQVRVRPHQQREGFPMAELVVAPLLEPLEDRMDPQFRMPLELAEDGDVAGIADLLGQVGRVEDELRLEVVILLRLGQEAEVHADIHVLQRVVDEPGMPRFIPRHHAEQILHVRVGDALLDLGIKHAAGELGRHAADEEFQELLLQRLGQGAQVEGVEFRRADEVAAIRIRVELRHQRIPLLPHRLDADRVHRGEIGGVEARRQHGLGQRELRALTGGGRAPGGRHGVHAASLGSKPQ